MQKIFELYGKKIVLGSLIFLFGVNFIIWPSVFAASGNAEMSVRFFNVGQGDSIFITSKDGTQILIDGGPGPKILSELAQVMPYYDRSIDIILLTHPHADHVAGLIDVMKRYEVSNFIYSGAEHDTAEYRELKELVEKKGINVVIADQPFDITFFRGAVIKLLYPDRSLDGVRTKDVNETSIVSLLQYGGKRVLFTGDAGADTERKLIGGGALEDIDVLKVGHQGSKFSSTKEFLDIILPEYAVISVGKNNYGHPHKDALSRLSAVGAEVFRTDRDGTVILEIRNGELYWK